MNGSRLGELEGKLDAVLAGYVAAFLDIRGPDASAFLGDLDTGYVLLPNPPDSNG
jgi:predicted RNase H-like nuclease